MTLAAPIPPRPPTLPLPDPVGIPSVLRERPQWVCWRYEWRDDKWTKVPYAPGRRHRASSTTPSTWGTLEAALAGTGSLADCAGIGYVFSPDDPFCGVDLDGCIDGNGVIAPGAQQIIDSFSTYTEISPSGTGVKLILIGTKPASAKCKSKAIGGYKETEVYDRGRFFTITGRHLGGTPIQIIEGQAVLDALCARLWPAKTATVNRANGSGGGGVVGDDDALIKAAMGAGNGAKFKRLWEGDISEYAGDESGADLALLNMLAFWTGRDAARMERLFGRSKLARDKWRDRPDYRQRSIARAIQDCAEVYRPPAPAKSQAAATTPAAGGANHDDLDGGPVPLGQRDPDSGKLVLSPRRTDPTARAYLAEHHAHPDGPTLLSYADNLMLWSGNRYVEVPDAHLRNTLQPWLHKALRYVKPRSGDPYLAPFESNPNSVHAALESIRTRAYVPALVPPPYWLDGGAGRPPAVEILPCRTCNLHVPTGRILPATPALFTINALEFDYQSDPEPPEQWIRFLEQLQCQAGTSSVRTDG